MKRNLFWLTVFLLVTITGAFAQDGAKDLQWAKSLLEHGDYAYAAEKFSDIAASHYNSTAIRKEALYYVGYCHVKNNDPWQAIRVFEQFLEKYDKGSSSTFVPDALYVLGRVYEETGDNHSAIKVYRRCSQVYPGSQFARKSQERLYELGDSSGSTDPFDDNYDGNDHHHPGYDEDPGYDHDHSGHQPEISREIRHLLRVAETVSNSFTRDQMLLEGSDRARSGEDFVALANAIENTFTRGQLLERVSKNANYSQFSTASMLKLAALINNSYQRDTFLIEFGSALANRDYVANYELVEISAAMNNDMLRQQLFDAISESKAFKFINARTMVELAQTCKNSYIHDQLLLQAAQKNQYSYRELRILADACSNSFTKSQILQLDGADHSYPHRARNAAIAPQPAVSKNLASDPFNSFNFNKAQLKRISAFILSVDQKSGMRVTVKNLKKSDLNKQTVREYMEKYRILQKFERIHHR